MELNVYIKSVKLNKIKDYPLPAFIDFTSTVYSIVDAIQKASSCSSSSSTAKTKVDDHFSLILMLILSLLEPFID